MTDKVVVLVTCSSAEEAARIANTLVEERLAACVNISSPIRSVYRWQGKVCDAAEVLLVIKTTRELFDRVRRAVERLHSYQVPEVICLPIIDGAPNYLNWIGVSVKPEPEPEPATPTARPRARPAGRKQK
jgi:periplasmic divalent cation tolerance protein